MSLARNSCASSIISHTSGLSCSFPSSENSLPSLSMFSTSSSFLESILWFNNFLDKIPITSPLMLQLPETSVYGLKSSIVTLPLSRRFSTSTPSLLKSPHSFAVSNKASTASLTFLSALISFFTSFIMSLMPKSWPRSFIALCISTPLSLFISTPKTLHQSPAVNSEVFIENFLSTGTPFSL